MHHYSATVTWERQGAVFSDRRYSRGHVWRLDGGIEVPASSSPLVVRVPLSVEAAIDPEEGVIAALASCHMLFFLDLAARAGHVVDSYQDRPVGTMGKDEGGHDFIAEIDLRPEIAFAGDGPAAEQLDALHDKAHAACFIARTLRSRVTIHGRHG